MKINYTLITGAVIAAVLAYKFKDMKSVGAGIGGAAFDMVDGVVSGAVVKVGEAVGIPATNQTACQKAIAEGRTWDASFACPATDFLGSVFGKGQTFDAGSGGNEW